MDSKFIKLLLLTVLCPTSGVLISLLTIQLCSSYFDIPYDQVSSSLDTLSSSFDLTISKILLFANSFGIFILPGLLFAFIFYKKPFSFLKLDRKDSLLNFVLIPLIFIVSLPVLNVFVELNKNMALPDFLSEVETWMRQAEDSALQLTNSLLVMENKTDLIINILLIGVVPAVGEELVFRGVLQQIFTKNKKNYHIGIWGAAAIFSAIHFQFYGFIPRLLLGALFGYLFYWSANLWVPIFAHFINNSVAVLVAYNFRESGIEQKLEEVGTTSNTWFLSVIFLFALFGLLYLFKNLKWSQNQEQEVESRLL